uniref:NADH dehydrogenase subunit 5 n=1 Tax=Tridentiger trigonocephalus TaxID=55557 RepID=A0A140HDB6_9GOBI|nr:NADH dehydrogenase subunit 5 [Tridentiger trigonocephalus]AMO02255.1 NADH dehydrogenase subunit 5 [Tridentiger trigonocephalus]
MHLTPTMMTTSLIIIFILLLYPLITTLTPNPKASSWALTQVKTAVKTSIYYQPSTPDPFHFKGGTNCYHHLDLNKYPYFWHQHYLKVWFLLYHFYPRGPMCNLVYPTICLMMHACWPKHKPIFYMSPDLPNCHNYSCHSYQHISNFHWLGGGTHYILSTNWLMMWAGRCKHSCTPSSSLWPCWGYWINLLYSMNSHQPLLLKNATNFYSCTNYTPNLPPFTSYYCCHWQIRPIWTSPLATRCHTTPHTSISPTPLKHYGSSSHFLNNPHKSFTTKLPFNLNYLPMPWRSNNLIYSNMCINTEWHYKNCCLFNILPAWPHNSNNWPKPTSACISAYLHPCILQSHAFPMLMLYYSQPKWWAGHPENTWHAPFSPLHFLLFNSTQPCPHWYSFFSWIFFYTCHHWSPECFMPYCLSPNPDSYCHLFHRYLQPPHCILCLHTPPTVYCFFPYYWKYLICDLPYYTSCSTKYCCRVFDHIKHCPSLDTCNDYAPPSKTIRPNCNHYWTPSSPTISQFNNQTTPSNPQTLPPPLLCYASLLPTNCTPSSPKSQPLSTPMHCPPNCMPNMTTTIMPKSSFQNLPPTYHNNKYCSTTHDLNLPCPIFHHPYVSPTNPYSLDSSECPPT